MPPKNSPGARSGRLRAALAACALSIALPGCVASQLLVADAEARFPDRGEHVRVEGFAASPTRLRYVERGTGRPIVLVHGAFGGVEDWEATLLPAVAERGRAIAFDRPGHGWSSPVCGAGTPAAQAAVLRAAAHAVGAERPVLVGFSYGGAVAAAWAAAWPDEVAGLVLLNAPTHAWGGSPTLIEDLSLLPVVGDLFVWNVATPLAAIVAPGRKANAFAPEPMPAAFDASPVDLALRPRSFLANAEEIRSLDPALAAQSAGYERITCPVVFLVGSGDQVVGPEHHSPRFLAQVPHAERRVVPGAGHQLPYAHPGACLDALDRVLSADAGAVPEPGESARRTAAYHHR
jgi:pimeloyl-ACP methyl ester carboxylesterase